MNGLKKNNVAELWRGHILLYTPLGDILFAGCPSCSVTTFLGGIQMMKITTAFRDNKGHDQAVM